MGFDITRFKTDETLEKEGVWVDAGGGLRLKVARSSNYNYEEDLRKLGKPYVRQIRLGTVDNETIEKISIKAFAKHVLKDWENLEDEKGNEILYSPAKAEELLLEYRDFYKLVQEFAQEQDLYRQEQMEDSEGNLKSA